MRRLPKKLESLTAREREVLSLIGRGMSLSDIARQLHRSPKTVESHRLSLGRKLGASNRVELARMAITAGLAPLTESTAADENDLEKLRGELSAHAAAWNAMRALDAALATCTGHQYLRELPVRLCEVLNGRCVMLSELSGKGDRAQRDVLAYERKGRLLEWEQLPLANTPCAEVVAEGFARYDHDIQRHFPNNPLLEQTEAHSFIGVRLTGAQQTPIGVLALIHEAPFDDRLQPDIILRICASRAAAELERARMDEKLLAINEQLERRVQQRTMQLQQLNHQLEQRLEQIRRTQRQLEQSEQRFRTLVETMNEGLAAMDAHGTLTYVNHRFAEILGHTPEALIGRSPTEFIADARQAAWFSSREFERRRDMLESYRLDMQRSDGTIVTLRVSPKSLYDDQGHYIGSFGVVSEITPGPDQVAGPPSDDDVTSHESHEQL